MNEFLKFWLNTQSSTKIVDNPFHKASTYLKTNWFVSTKVSAFSWDEAWSEKEVDQADF